MGRKFITNFINEAVIKGLLKSSWDKQESNDFIFLNFFEFLGNIFKMDKQCAKCID